MVSYKVATKLWKNSRDVAAINTDFSLPRGVCIALWSLPGSLLRGVSGYFSARSMVTSDLTLGEEMEGEVEEGKFQYTSGLCLERVGGRCICNLKFSGVVPNLMTLPEIHCLFSSVPQTLQGEKVHQSLILSVRRDKTLSVWRICSNLLDYSCSGLCCKSVACSYCFLA